MLFKSSTSSSIETGALDSLATVRAPLAEAAAGVSGALDGEAVTGAASSVTPELLIKSIHFTWIVPEVGAMNQVGCAEELFG
jgi:hypothetical protein